MRKIIQQTALTALLLALVLPTSVSANDAELIWMKNELAPFKERLVPARELTLQGLGPILPEEWAKFNSETLDALKLNEPISTSNWGTLMKLTVRMPADAKIQASSLQSYVDDFNQQGFIRREDAVGGMVKLLSLRTLNASSKEGDPDPRLALKDVSDIHDKQLGLFHIAYREGLLDSFVTDQFRPKDLVTHREAVSMAYHIMQKYGAPFGYDTLWPDRHWSSNEVKIALRGAAASSRFQRFASILTEGLPALSQLDQPITPEIWHKLILAIGVPHDSTSPVPSGNSVIRSSAIDELVSLYGPLHEQNESNESNEPIKPKATSLKASFADISEASNPHMLAVAADLGWAEGDADGCFHPRRSLTYAEAFTLAVRVSHYIGKTERN